MQSYETISEALTDLRSKGYTLDFNLSFNQLMCRDQAICLHPEDFEITARYRFEGDSNPDDEDVLYVVESKDGKLKGTITSAYGLYADNLSTEMIRKLSFHQ